MFFCDSARSPHRTTKPSGGCDAQAGLMRTPEFRPHKCPRLKVIPKKKTDLDRGCHCNSTCNGSCCPVVAVMREGARKPTSLRARVGCGEGVEEESPCCGGVVWRIGFLATPSILRELFKKVNTVTSRHTKRIIYQKTQTQRALPSLPEAPRQKP